MIAGFRHLFSCSASPTANSIADVAMPTRGHSELKAIPSERNSAAIPQVIIDVAYLDTVSATWRAHHLSPSTRGGDMLRTCGLPDRRRKGLAALVTKTAPRALMSIMRS